MSRAPKGKRSAHSRWPIWFSLANWCSKLFISALPNGSRAWFNFFSWIAHCFTRPDYNSYVTKAVSFSVLLWWITLKSKGSSDSRTVLNGGKRGISKSSFKSSWCYYSCIRSQFSKSVDSIVPPISGFDRSTYSVVFRTQVFLSCVSSYYSPPALTSSAIIIWSAANV